MAKAKHSTADFRGARGSNAGDQFHELWALQRALSLLIPNTSLSALTVEGVASDADSTNDDANKWEGADCTLYFGGRTLQTSSRVEIVQLKYSSSAPEAPWTIARLTQSTKKQGNNSVLRRLADAFAGAQAVMKADATLAVRLVSNQSVAEGVSKAISGYLKSGTTGSDLKKIHEATGLSENDLITLLRILDLSECGTSSRFSLRDQIVATVAKSVNDDVNAQVRELKARIRDLMMPEAAREVITTETVLGWFDIASKRGLFPAPSEFKSIASTIARIPTQSLFAHLVAGVRLVCLHGPAGCGKTTTVKQLESLLPEGSAFVAFDCYGAGRYSHTDDRRHLPENAFVQISNELSLKLGIPYLLARSGRRPVEVQQFVQHLDSAALLLKKTHPTALMVISIDAADNSVTAALRQSPPDKCFVHELVQANLGALPDNVRFVISTRSGRKDSLRLPHGTTEVLCPPFEKRETEQFVRLSFTQASEAWVEQFHALSRGIPRVQNYAMTAGSGDLALTLDALRPGGKGLSDVLRQLFVAASGKMGDSNLYLTFMAALAALPAPVPARHLAAACAVTTEEVLDIVSDIEPGLRVDADGLSIADEDVEDFIAAEGAKRLTEVQRAACTYFSGIYLTDTYAAIHYSDFLVATGREAEVLSIIEKDLAPAAIADPVVRREAQLRRLRQALSACEAAGDAVASTKVVLLSAEASKGEAVLADILQKHPDLSVRFARASLNRLVLSEPDNAYRQGPVLAQIALTAAQKGDRVQARENLHLHDVWLRRQRRVPKNERSAWAIRDEDIVARSEAILLVFGIKRTLEELGRWSPANVPLRVALELVPALIARGYSQVVTEALEKNRVRAAWRLLLMVPLALSGATFSLKQWERALRGIRKSSVPQLADIGYVSHGDAWQTGFLDNIVTACEIGLSVGVSDKVVGRALRTMRNFNAHPKQRFHSTEASKLELTLRGWLVHQHIKGAETTSEQFLSFIEPPPKKTAPKSKKKIGSRPTRDRSDDEVKEFVQAIFPVYLSRLVVLTDSRQGKANVASLNGYSSTAYSFETRHWAHSFRANAAASVLSLLHLPALPPLELFEKAQALANTKYSDPFATRLLQLWKRLLLRQDCHAFILKEVTRKAEQTQKERAPASEKVDALLEFSRTVLNFSEPDAQSFFEEAVARAQDIDREAFDQIEFLRACTDHSAIWDVEARKRLASNVYRFVTDVAERLNNEEHFPWKDGIQTIARLSPEAIFAASAQWSDYGIRGHEYTLIPMLQELLVRQTISPGSAASLLILTEVTSEGLVGAIVAASAKSDAEHHKAVTELLASDCLLVTPPDARLDIGNAVLQNARARTGCAFEKLEQTVQFIQAHTPSEKKEPPSVGVDHATLDFSGRKFLTSADITAGIEEVRKQEKYISTEKVLRKITETVTAPGDRVPFLEALASAKLEYYNADDRAEVLQDTLEAWSSTPSVTRWRSTRLAPFIIDNFSALARTLKYQSRVLARLLESFPAGAGERQRILIKGVQGTGQTLGSESLFQVAGLLAATLNPQEAWAMLTWYTERLTKRLPDEARALDPADLPTNIDAAVGRFVFTFMSDIDTRVRWRAAHAARRLAMVGEQEAVNAIFATYERTSDVSFRDPSAPYYWLAARLWAVIASARIAAEAPSAIVPHIEKLTAIALSEQLPHVLIREYAKRAVLSVVSFAQITLPADVLSRLQTINTPMLPAGPKAPHQRVRRLGWDDTKGRRFDFDSEMLEHPYTKVFRKFESLTKEEFFQALEGWLVDRWNAPEKVRYWDREPRKGRYDERRYQLWYSRDGALAIVERYGNYLERHALYCAVGELITNHALVTPDYDSDSYDSWLAEGLVTTPPSWLSDFRDPAPLQVPIWFEDEHKEASWLSRISKQRFMDTLHPDGTGSEAFITLRGDWTAMFPTREVNTRVTSALVSPETASALIRALHEAEHHYGVWLPDEGNDDEIRETGYQLLGWLGDEDHDQKFDRHDPLTHEIRATQRVPGAELVIACDLQAKAQPDKNWTIGVGGQVGLRVVVWSDTPAQYDDGGYRQRRTKSDGWQVRLRGDLLSRFLKFKKMDLIVGVQIERRTANEYGRSYDPDTKKKTFNRVYLYRSDGRIEDTKGCVGSWKRLGKRVQA